MPDFRERDPIIESGGWPGFRAKSLAQAATTVVQCVLCGRDTEAPNELCPACNHAVQLEDADTHGPI